MNQLTDLQIFKTVIEGVKADNALTPQKIANLNIAQGLKAGTQILLADGSSKNIEDIQYGDIIQSWNWIDKTPIAAKAYGAIALGYTDHWTRHIFSNGLFIDVHTDMYLYSRSNGIPKLLSTWEPHFNAHTFTNERVQEAWRAPYDDIIFTPSYLVLCETGLFFANGLLCAHTPQDLYKYSVLDKIPQATQEELEYFYTIAQMQKENEMCRISNPLYLLGVAPIATQMAACDRANKKGERLTLFQQLKMAKKNSGDTKKSVSLLYKEIHAFQIARIKAQKES